jgi:hypothetical protein
MDAEPGDIASFEQGLSILAVAGHLLEIDPFYCKMISRIDFSDCVANDGVVPEDSQRFPGATNVIMGLGNDGPAHIQETAWSGDAIYDTLVWSMNVPRRVPTPAPTPTPDPEPDPDPDPNPDPSPAVGPAPNSPDTLSPGELLRPGDIIHSSSGRYHLGYQGDGNLVLYDENWLPLWASDTAGTSAGVVGMQGDGNFVMYDATNTPVWSSGDSFNHPGAWLGVQNDGNVVIYDVDGTPLWATNTAR